MNKRCEKCQGELRMKASIQEHSNRGSMTFINVPVTGCRDCGNEGYSMKNGLIIEHYAKFHGENDSVIDFEEIYVAYENMSVLELMSLSNTSIQ